MAYYNVTVIGFLVSVWNVKLHKRLGIIVAYYFVEVKKRQTAVYSDLQKNGSKP